MYVLQITAMHDNELTSLYRPTRYGHALYGDFTPPLPVAFEYSQALNLEQEKFVP